MPTMTTSSAPFAAYSAPAWFAAGRRIALLSDNNHSRVISRHIAKNAVLS